METSKTFFNDLELLIRSHYGLICIETDEEERAETILKHLADHLSLAYFSWSSTKGLRKNGTSGAVYGSENLAQALGHIENTAFPAIYHFPGLRDHLQDKIIAQRLKDSAVVLSNVRGAIVLTGLDLDLPESIQTISMKVKLPLPTTEDYKNLLKNTLTDLSKRMHIQLEMKPEELMQLINNLNGLTLLEAKKIITRLVIEDNKLSLEDLKHAITAKKHIVEREGLLEYYPHEENLTDIADLRGLKTWLAQRKAMITNPKSAIEFGLSFPKGILLLGVQGCGKSLCAKAVAVEWQLPLLKLDPSNLYNKYIGESEKNFKRALRVAEQVAPVVLWIDEIEKAFASTEGGEDGGVSTRVFGQFLTWMQEKKASVFIIATANNIEKLPPEFLRKGRFDEIFFVDLPTEEARKAIFEIHLKKRGRNPALFQLDALVSATNGFSGAEIEQAVVSGLYSVFSKKAELTTETLLNEISLTRPLSITMKEKIDALREWAKERTVSAQ